MFFLMHSANPSACTQGLFKSNLYCLVIKISNDLILANTLLWLKHVMPFTMFLGDSSIT